MFASLADNFNAIFSKSTKTTLRGNAAAGAASFMGEVAHEHGQISAHQWENVRDAQSLNEELDYGWRQPVGTVYETKEGEEEVVYATSSSKEEECLKWGREQIHKAEKQVEENKAIEPTLANFMGWSPHEKIAMESMRKESPKKEEEASEVDDALKEALDSTEASPSPSVEDTLFLQMWDGVSIDLDAPKKKWPNEVKSRIKYKTWKNFTRVEGGSTGYYETLEGWNFGLPRGTVLRGTDHSDRKMIILIGDKTEGNVIIFRRYSPEETRSPIVANGGITEVSKGGASTLEDINTLLGNDPEKDNIFR